MWKSNKINIAFLFAFTDNGDYLLDFENFCFIWIDICPDGYKIFKKCLLPLDGAELNMNFTYYLNKFSVYSTLTSSEIVKVLDLYWEL